MINFKESTKFILNTLYAFIFLFLLGCENVQYIEMTGQTMGTTYSIIAVNDKNSHLNVNELKNGIDSLLNIYNLHFSTYIEVSEVVRFNRNSTSDYISVSPQFYDLFLESNKIYKMTDGAFDITVGPIVKLWGFGPNFNKNIIPYENDVNRTLQLVGTEKLVYKDGKIKKNNPAIEVDFSAIAKGGGVDIVSNYLITKNIDRFMVEIGGELTVSGYNINNQKWRIGIRKPEKYGLDVTEKIEITNISIATSGTYENYFIKDGIKYSHIIDPVSGKPIKHDLVSVTVLADNASTADAIATALMVFGYDRALEWVNSTHQIECLLISKLSTGEYKMGISKDFPIN